MQWSKPEEEQQLISKVAYHKEEDEFVITWQWPKELEFVYVYVYKEGKELPLASLDESMLKLYSRNEYKSNAGYRERQSFIGTFTVRIFPCVVDQNHRITVLEQLTADNYVRISGTKAMIEYRIKYTNPLFSKHRKARIRVFCETQIDRAVLCYVKNEGGVPLSLSDGLLYAFPNDFIAGETILPDIFIKKNEYLRLFFTDGKVYGESYELVQK